MNISISTGAFGSPTTSPFCGMPLKRPFASDAPCAEPSQLWLPVAGRSFRSPELTTPPPPPPPLLRTTPSTTAITMASTTPPAIASERGDAWRARTPPTPFERTGGGAVTAAACLCCLALLPLGMGGKGSRYIGFPGGREDQESDEKEEGREGESRDREVAERVIGDPVRAAAAGYLHGAGLRLVDHVLLDEHVVDRGAGADDRQGNQVAASLFAPPGGNKKRKDRERVNQDAREQQNSQGMKAST